jgi:hypothetical protein
MSPEDKHRPTPAKQAWNYREFVRCYNEVADEHGGYYFREEIAEPEALKEEYEQLGQATLHDYALSTYQLDQQY